MSQYLQNIVSHRVCAKINEHKGSQEVAIDPATAVLIGKILIKAVVLIKNCKKSTSEREDAIRNPSLLDLGGLKKIVRKELGWFRYLFLGAKIMRASERLEQTWIMASSKPVVFLDPRLILILTLLGIQMTPDTIRTM